ncbi:hypothetical protein AK812_SmicGene46870, partial [Symbiodinium microadriaticum]
MSSGGVPSATVDATDEDIRELTVQLRRCSVTAQIEPSEASASASRQDLPAASDGEPVRARVPLAGSTSTPTVLEDDLRVLDLSSPTELGAIDLGHLNSLAGDMARGALGRQPLIEEDIRNLLGEAPPRRPLPILLLQDVDPEWRAVVYVVRVRAGGFGIVAPLLESVQAALEQIVDDDGEAAVLTARRRAAFDPGVCANHRDAAETAFGEWIAEAGLDETMLEYLTAEEEAGPLAAEPGAVGGIEDPAAQLAALQERLEVLQRQVNEVPRPAPEPPLVDRAPGPGRARALFAAEPGPLTAQDWQTLRQLAGGAPPRIGGPERALQPEREHTGNILTEADLGAAVADDELQALALRNQDPLQKILAAQTLLLHRVLPKPVDALSAALEGVGSEQ